MTLENFVRESNKIEGILRNPTEAELNAHATFIKLPKLTVADIITLVAACQPNAVLRDNAYVPRVQVGGHVAPPSGPNIVKELETILTAANNYALTPWEIHVRYEILHPFTDGNGRAGRAIWLWYMIEIGQGKRAFNLGFLHSFYYQTLSEAF